MAGRNRIMIYGPKDDGTYVVEFMTADGDVLSISIPRTETHVIRHFQERSLMGYSCQMLASISGKEQGESNIDQAGPRRSVRLAAAAARDRFAA
jgi:hypothetical protein